MTIPLEELQPDLLILRRVDTITTHTNLPAQAWKHSDPSQKQAMINGIRGNLLGALEQRFPDMFYDFVEFGITDPAQDGSLLTIAPDKTLQRIIRATCVVNVYDIGLAEPSTDARDAFLKWVAQTLVPESLEVTRGAVVEVDAETVLDRLADAWAQGLRPREEGLV